MLRCFFRFATGPTIAQFSRAARTATAPLSPAVLVAAALFVATLPIPGFAQVSHHKQLRTAVGDLSGKLSALSAAFKKGAEDPIDATSRIAAETHFYSEMKERQRTVQLVHDSAEKFSQIQKAIAPCTPPCGVSKAQLDVISKAAAELAAKQVQEDLKALADAAAAAAAATVAALQAAAVAAGALWGPVGPLIAALLAAVAAVIILIQTIMAQSLEAQAAAKEREAGQKDPCSKPSSPCNLKNLRGTKSGTQGNAATKSATPAILSPGLLESDGGFSRQGPAMTGAPSAAPAGSLLRSR